jgi:hypothetical protein
MVEIHFDVTKCVERLLVRRRRHDSSVDQRILQVLVLVEGRM